MKNCFDRTPHTMKDWLLLAVGTAAVFAAADWLPDVLRGAGAFLGLLAPFGWGLLLAYVLDIPTRFFAQKLFGGRRSGAMAVSYALFFGALALLAALVIIPAMAAGGADLSDGGPGLMFIFLVNVFNGMPGGRVIGLVFFLCVLFAGLTSLVNLYEVSVEALQDKLRLKRVAAVAVIAVIGLSLIHI